MATDRSPSELRRDLFDLSASATATIYWDIETSSPINLKQ